jgi:hypothetical protein
MSGRRNARRIVTAVIVTAMIFVGWAYVSKWRDEARRMGAICHLGWMALALENYEWHHGTLPPVCLRDEAGKPLHSWRTLILPEMEIATEYLAELDLSQPWNSEKNMRFAKGLPKWSRDLFHRYPHQRTDGRTYLMALLGANSIWDRETGRPKGKLKQYPTSVLLLSLPTTDVDFMEPLEITEEELLARVQEGQEVLFITAGRGYGIVGINEGRLTWELSL